MPTYGYRCQSCQREFDVWQRMTDEPKASCPTCGGDGKRLFFPAGLVFKGSGFYATDNRRGSAGTASANGSGEGGASTTKTSKPDSASSSGATTGSGAASGTTSE
jgi:putative FmdB family regulatory protein